VVTPLRVSGASNLFLQTQQLVNERAQRPERGGAKAKLLLSLGYQTDAPEALESDLRTQHLPLDPTRTSENPYGVAYEID
jgi:hypothetical protein